MYTYTYMYRGQMATKTITIKDEAYRRLKALKEEGDSFSDVIMKLTEPKRNDFSDLIGLDIELDWEKIKAHRKTRMGEDVREEVLTRH